MSDSGFLYSGGLTCRSFYLPAELVRGRVNIHNFRAGLLPLSGLIDVSGFASHRFVNSGTPRSLRNGIYVFHSFLCVSLLLPDMII